MENQKIRGFRIKDCIYKEFQETCELNNATTSKVIRRLIIDYIKQYKKKN